MPYFHACAVVMVSGVIVYDVDEDATGVGVPAPGSVVFEDSRRPWKRMSSVLATPEARA